MENLVTLTVNSTHFYLIDCQGGKLLVDAGWGMPQFTSQMKAHKIGFSEIRYVMFTHHHPDHSGLVQNIKDASRARLIIHEKQIPFLENLRSYAEKMGPYEPVRVEKDDLVSPNRAAFKLIGIEGEILETPGHSDDSISLLLDSGSAFTGDLTRPDFAPLEQVALVRSSWRALISHGARLIYPSHANPVPVEQIQKYLAE